MSDLADFVGIFLEREFAAIHGKWTLETFGERNALYSEALMCHAPKPLTPSSESWSMYSLDVGSISRTPSSDERAQMLELIGPRTVFKRSYYAHPELGEVLRVYVSKPRATELPAYDRRIDFAEIDGKPYVVAYGWICTNCFGSGQIDGVVCRGRSSDDNPVCQDGWKPVGGMTLNNLSEAPTRVERLTPPDEPRSFDVHERDA